MRVSNSIDEVSYHDNGKAGTNMAVTTTLTEADIQAAITAVSTYASTCQTIFNTMNTTLTELVNHDGQFLGMASTGYDTLYQSMRPVLSEQL